MLPCQSSAQQEASKDTAMNDWYNDPPDYDEPPEWYMTLEEALEMEPPKEVADAIRAAIDAWNAEQAAAYPDYTE